MRSMLATVIAIATVVTTATPTMATICSTDAVPAATLLFPYVVFDYNDYFTGDNTLLYITNTGPDAQIVHVTFWSDVHVPVLTFNILLSGYDQEALDVRNIFVNGLLPSTNLSTSGAVAEIGPVDGFPDLPVPSSTATLSQRCPASVPGYPGSMPDINAAVLALIRQNLQYSQTKTRLHSDCAGTTYGIGGSTFDQRDTDDPTWMYVTADVVWTCNQMAPDVDGALYWADGPTNNPGFSPTGAQRMTDNVLMGEVVWLNESLGHAESMAAVHIEADAALGDTTYNSPVRNPTTGMVQTFAHTQSAIHGVSDGREPLPTAWGLGFPFHNPGIGYTNSIRLWKAPSFVGDLDFPYTVYYEPLGPPWVFGVADGTPDEMLALDCLAYTYYAWDTNENVTTGVHWEPNLMPLAVQEIPVDEFALPDDSGWILFLWPPSNTDQADHYQTWMSMSGTTTHGSWARQGIVMGNANCVDPVHNSGFELGTTSGWGASVP